MAPYKACIADVAKALKAAAFAQRESFDNVQVLYILSKGLVALDSRVGHHGAVWGEDFVLSDTSLIRPVSGYALTYIEVLFLTRDALMEVIEKRRSSCPQLGRIVRQYPGRRFFSLQKTLKRHPLVPIPLKQSWGSRVCFGSLADYNGSSF